MTAIYLAYRRAYSGLPREVWWLSLVILLNRCGTMVLPFLALYLVDERGFTAGGAGQMLAVYGAGAIIGTQLGGWLTQHIGGVRVAMLGMGLAAPGFIAIPLTGDRWGLVLALFYLSIVYETTRPAVATATSDFTPKEMHPRAFALNRLAMNLGMSIGPLVGGVLAEVDYRYLFWVNGAFAAFASVALAVAFAGRSGAVAHEEPEASPSLLAAGPWRDRKFLAYLGVQFWPRLIFLQMMGALPLFWKQQWGIDESSIGLLFVINTLMIVAIEMVLIDYLRQYKPLRLVALANGVVCLGFGGAVLGEGFAWAALLMVVITLGEMLMMPFGMVFTASRGTTKTRGAYMGLNSAVWASAALVAPLLGTWLYEIDPRLPWWCCLALAAVLPVAMWRLVRE